MPTRVILGLEPRDTLTSTKRLAALLSIATLGSIALLISILWVSSYSGMFARAAVAQNTQLGRDFAVFYTAAVVIDRGEPESLYSPAEFTAAYRRLVGTSPPEGTTTLRYPPPAAMFVKPLASFPLETAFWIWTLVGVAALGVSVRILGMNLWAVGATALSVPVLGTIVLGQNSFILLALLAVSLALLRTRRYFIAGLALGLLIIKPQFLFIPVALLLTGWTNARRLFLGAAVTFVTVLGSSVAAAPDMWTRYLASSSVINPANTLHNWSFDALSMAMLIAPLRPVMSVAIWAALSIGLTVIAFRLLPKGTLAEEAYAWAVLIGIAWAPHVVAYDWVLLVIPGTLLWQTHRPLRLPLLVSAALLSAVSLFNARIVDIQYARTEWAISPAYLLLFCSIVWLLCSRRLVSAVPSGDSEARQNVPQELPRIAL